MRTETKEVTAGHKYHVYCALGGDVYKSKDGTLATGSVGVPDATAAGTIKFGGHEAIEFAAKAQTEDHAEAAPIEDYAERTKFSFDAYLGEFNIGGWYPPEQETPPASLAELAAFMNDYWSGQRVLQASVSGDKIVLTALSQYHGQQVSIRREDYDGYVFPFPGDEIVLTGGTDARTQQEVVDALNASADCPVVAQLDADELGISFTAKEYGVNDTITITGGLFADASGMSGGDSGRVLVGQMDGGELVGYEAQAGWPRIEVEVPDEGWVQVRDKDGARVAEHAPTEPGQFYNVYADDDVRILYRNTELLALPGFGGTGGFQAPGLEVTVLRKGETEVSIMDCAAVNCLSTVHYTYNAISDLT